jgi:acetylornithine deacetylase/succinyl-diaminopimelate desuccinylase-like protein
MREGGSIHVIGMLQQMLGLDTVLMGFALPDDAIHSPNERQHVPTFLKGIEAYTRFFHAAAAIEQG